MPDSMPRTQTPPENATAALVLGDGTVFLGPRRGRRRQRCRGGVL